MQTSQNTSSGHGSQRFSLGAKWYDRLWAAFIFFTRLPFWRIYQPPQTAYNSVVEWWPLTGWLTSSVMAAILYFGPQLSIINYPLSILFAIIARILLTGALHEDGLADFFDGFGGGGTNRERILSIMKDSHIGTYGVLGLILYLAMLYLCLYSMTPLLAAMTVLAADPYAKMLSAQMTQMMPYARTEETSKAHTVYRRMSVPSGLLLAVQGLLPIGLYFYFLHGVVNWEAILFTPCLIMYFLYLFVWRRLRGYTGDCCGAFFLLLELSVYLSVVITVNIEGLY